jgi:hypothetical protein
MSEHDWISVGQYTNLVDAQLVSDRLTSEGVPNRIYIPQTLGGTNVAPALECYVWVPPESAEEARRVLAMSAISEAELTDLALKYPPPDDL